MTISVGQPIISKPIKYGEFGLVPEQGGQRYMRICKVPVYFNGTVTEAVAHAVSVNKPIPGAPETVTESYDVDDAPLKWANLPDYKRLLVGGMTVYLGLFEIHDDGVYLHTVSDTYPKKPIITEPGDYRLGFRIDSADHCLKFTLNFTYADHSASLGG